MYYTTSIKNHDNFTNGAYYVKKMSFSKKLLFSVLSVVFLSYLLTTLVITTKSFDSAENISEELLINQANVDLQKVKQVPEKAVVAAYSLAASIEAVIQTGVYSEDSIAKMVYNTLEKNPYAIGAWIGPEPGKIFSLDFTRISEKNIITQMVSIARFLLNLIMDILK